jgi:hypothetical protein
MNKITAIIKRAGLGVIVIWTAAIGVLAFFALAVTGVITVEDTQSNVTPAEAAEFIWDQEADELDFCSLYWGLPYVEVYEKVFLVRAAGMSDPAETADEMLTIAAREC